MTQSIYAFVAAAVLSLSLAATFPAFANSGVGANSAGQSTYSAEAGAGGR